MSNRRTGKHRIYMNVGYDLTEEQLRQFFSQYGQVTDVYLPKHKSGRNKGFGFTTFDSEESLQAALQAEQYQIAGEVVRINRAGPRPESELLRDSEDLEASSSSKQLDAYNRQPQLFGKGPRLYVGGVPEELTEERLKTHFSRWGNVVDLYFPGKKGQSRVNYCFVTFDNWRAAQKACNQSERNIDGIPLQSINVAQERSAEQETTQPANSAQPAPAAEVEPKPAAPPLAANAFSMEGRAGMLPLPAYSMMQQLHLQVMQAQALQAQQLGVGFPAQQQQQPVPNGVALADSEQMSAFLASNPVAYQQLLATMAASQGLRLTPNSTAIAPPAARPSQPAMAAAPGYGMQAAPLFQFPQGMPGMPTPSDLSHLQALGAQSGVTHPPADHQQLGLHQGPSSLRNDMPMDLSRHPSIMSTTVDSMPGFPLQQPPSAGIYSPMAFQGTSPGMWGWGTLGTDGHAGGAAPDTAAPSPFANPQLQSRPGSASVPSVPMTGPQFGVFSLDGFGPSRTNTFIKPRNPYAPY